MNKPLRSILDILWYCVIYILLQLVSNFVVFIIAMIMDGKPFSTALTACLHGKADVSGDAIVLASILGSLLLIFIFARHKYTPVSPAYLQQRPWPVLIWTVLLSIGLIIPAEWLLESMHYEMPPDYKYLFKKMLTSHWAYFNIALIGPVAEEMLFRGAILRKLLSLFKSNLHWVAIVISALIFGAVHGNLAQGFNAFLAGLVLGWMYYRTGSLIPGIAFHWTNNTVSYIVCRVMPDKADAKLIDLFGGNAHTVLLAVLFSLCIALPSLFQLATRLKKADAGQ